MKILLVAYACEPNRGSEPGVGWHVALELAKRHDVTVVTRANNQDVIDAAQPPRHLRFVYVDAASLALRLKRGSRGIHAYQIVWQTIALKAARRLHRQSPFDLVHHVTFSTAWYPSLFCFVGPPFVWGPLGANQPVPANLAADLLSRRERFANHVRRFLNGPQAKRNPLVRIARDRAARLLIVNPYVATTMAPRHRRKCQLFPAVGAEDPGAPPEFSTTAPLRAIFLGRLIGLKGVDLALRALATANGAIELTIVGDGPRRGHLERETLRLGLVDRVRFTGAVTHVEATAMLGSADVMIFPAFDTGGMAVIEAFARAVPVVALDVGGPAASVDGDSGILVPVGSTTTIVRDLARALDTLALDAELRRTLSEGARRRFLSEYEWGAKGRALATAVESVVAEAANR